ncbi:MAG: hypothetical protein ACYC3X_15265 [Pirellulaceae bacterium]
MRLLPICCAAGLAVAGLHAFTPAQEFWGGMPWGGNFQAHASTAAEGAARGVADVVQAAGAANLMNSAAAINVEKARSQYIDNRLKWTKTYFEMKQYNKDYRTANKSPRPTSEQLFRLAKEATPKPLSPDSLDPVTGQIKWPEVLMVDDFAECRGTLESLYANRANASGKINLEQYNEIRQSIGQMRGLLKAKLNDLPPQVFTQANAFIRQLEYAAQLTG